MAQRSNYLVGTNPFHLAGPPASWLRELAIFDADLVLFPSMDSPFLYRLARRVQRGRPLLCADRPQVKDFLPTEDTKFLARHRLVPVTTLLPGIQWGPAVFAELAARDLWRHGGAQKAVDGLERREADAKAKKQAAIADEAGERAREMYHSYTRRVGSRISLPGPRPMEPYVVRDRRAVPGIQAAAMFTRAESQQPLISTPAA